MCANIEFGCNRVKVVGYMIDMILPRAEVGRFAGLASSFERRRERNTSISFVEILLSSIDSSDLSQSYSGRPFMIFSFLILKSIKFPNNNDLPRVLSISSPKSRRQARPHPAQRTPLYDQCERIQDSTPVSHTANTSRSSKASASTAKIFLHCSDQQ